MSPKETAAEPRAELALKEGPSHQTCVTGGKTRHDLELMTPLGREKPETKAGLELKGSSVQGEGETLSLLAKDSTRRCLLNGVRPGILIRGEISEVL